MRPVEFVRPGPGQALTGLWPGRAWAGLRVLDFLNTSKDDIPRSLITYAPSQIALSCHLKLHPDLFSFVYIHCTASQASFFLLPQHQRRRMISNNHTKRQPTLQIKFNYHNDCDTSIHCPLITMTAISLNNF